MQRKDPEVMADEGDVYVLPIGDDCPECDQAPATHYVTLDMRSAGVSLEGLRGCLACCERYAEGVRAGLPKESASTGK